MAGLDPATPTGTVLRGWPARRPAMTCTGAGPPTRASSSPDARTTSAP